ncbi:MAG: hypothetical protein ABIY70_25175 [Capsulimonas sp.]|uniref:hypothetical protein n=1 Tax=Capsulimonas sp. TaxID=2494211 RepID=UPI003262F4C4
MNIKNELASVISEINELNIVSPVEALQARQPGFAKDLLAGIDTDALLATPIDELFEEYTPAPEPPADSTHQP